MITWDPTDPILGPPIVDGQTTVLDARRFGDREYRFYRVPNIDRLLDEIDPKEWEKDERMPYWAELWRSGEALATLLAATPLRGVRVLELGCGLGLPSIVAASRGALVTASDYIPDALELLAVNARLNGVDVRRVELDWRAPADVGRFDLVVAADVLYEQWQVDALVKMLARTMAPAGRSIVVDPDRRTAKEFANAALFRGFRVARRVESGPDATAIHVYDLAWRDEPPPGHARPGRT